MKKPTLLFALALFLFLGAALLRDPPVKEAGGLGVSSRSSFGVPERTRFQVGVLKPTGRGIREARTTVPGLPDSASQAPLEPSWDLDAYRDSPYARAIAERIGASPAARRLLDLFLLVRHGEELDPQAEHHFALMQKLQSQPVQALTALENALEALKGPGYDDERAQILMIAEGLPGQQNAVRTLARKELAARFEISEKLSGGNAPLSRFDRKLSAVSALVNLSGRPEEVLGDVIDAMAAERNALTRVAMSGFLLDKYPEARHDLARKASELGIALDP